jgi:hypothetical protein
VLREDVARPEPQPSAAGLPIATPLPASRQCPLRLARSILPESFLPQAPKVGNCIVTSCFCISAESTSIRLPSKARRALLWPCVGNSLARLSWQAYREWIYSAEPPSPTIPATLCLANGRTYRRVLAAATVGDKGRA